VLSASFAIPGLVGAGDPWLTLQAQPARPVVLESSSERDAIVSLVVENPSGRRVRVDDARWVYAGGTQPAGPTFAAAGLPLPLEIEEGDRETWAGLCLVPPAAGTSSVRLELDLSVRRGLKRDRRSQAFDLPLTIPDPPLVLDLPFTGAWRVTQGHACSTQHRRGKLGGEFAWDLAAVVEGGRSGTPRYLETHRNEDSATYGREIGAPVAGTVVAAVDGTPDNDEQREFPRRSLVETARAPKWIFGNYVVLDAGDGRFVLLAHLMKGSVAVKPGDRVTSGRILGRAGNSGNTVLPHLHVQVMDRADPANPEVSGLPAELRDYVEITARGTATIRDASVRRVASGDPPQDAIIMRPESR
jgi:murein DD-endopeptidase MepM/ murein hydrolase activator NlpD